MAQRAGIQIGELSRRTGCNIVTIRYYEQIALLPEPARSAGRYRVYDTSAVSAAGLHTPCARVRLHAGRGTHTAVSVSR